MYVVLRIKTRLLLNHLQPSTICCSDEAAGCEEDLLCCGVLHGWPAGIRPLHAQFMLDGHNLLARHITGQSFTRNSWNGLSPSARRRGQAPTTNGKITRQSKLLVHVTD
jgi:hypothetical protein